jgi:carboxymethylenebutenolidase
MERKKATDFDPELLELFDGYVHGQVTKRAFFDQAAKFAVGGVTVAALVDSLMPNYALAQQVDPSDPDISGERITYDSPDGHGAINGYLVKPAGASGATPGVVVVHENRGLNPYIEDVARRVAKAGFTALAPDGLTPLGGYPGNDDDGRAMQKELDRAKLAEDFFAAFEHMMGRDDVTDKVGVVGFCYGGGISNAMAVRYAELGCAVPFYGRQASAEDVPAIQAPLLIHYGGLDERINKGWPAYEAALKEHGKAYTVHFYENANHGFHNDTTPRYDEAAATLAWDRTVAFFNEHLTG